jgi:hypothetical protein
MRDPQLGGKCPQVQADAGLDEFRQDGHRRSCPVHAERLITGFDSGTCRVVADLACTPSVPVR